MEERDSIAGAVVEENGNCSGNESEEFTVPLPGTQDQLRALATAKRIAECMGEDSAEFMRTVRRLQSSVRLQAVKGMRQATIDSFFK